MRTALSVAAWLLFVSAAEAQQTVIHSTVAIDMKADCADAVGFVVEGGPAADTARVRKTVQAKARAAHPKVRNYSHADNFTKDKFAGNHAVVVTAPNTKPGCATRAMGVGFGKDEATARKDAERRMGMIFPYHGRTTKVEFSKAF